MAQKSKLRTYRVGSLGVAVMLYCLVAAGAFGIEEIIPIAGPGMTLLLLAVFPLIWAAPICNIVSECNSLMPVEGGIFEWTKAAYGEFWGFQAGWWTIVSNYISSGTYVALTAGYTSQLLMLDDGGSFAVKVAMVALFTIINLLGFREVEKADVILSGIILVVFAIIAVVGFANWQANPFEPFVASSDWAGSLSEGILLVIWMYCGFECIAAMGGEIKDPMAIPRGLKIVLPLIALSYILPTMASIAALPEGTWMNWSVNGGLDAETIGYASVLTGAFGSLGVLIFLPVAIVSNCAIYNTYLASGSRSLFVLADDNLFPKSVAKLSNKRRMPYISILSISIASLIFSQLEFAELVELEVVFLLATYVLLAFTMVRLRRKYPVEGRREKGLYVVGGGKLGLLYSVIPPVVISCFTFMLCDLDYIIYGLLALMSGPLFYVIFKKTLGGMPNEADGAKFVVGEGTLLDDAEGAPIVHEEVAPADENELTTATTGEKRLNPGDGKRIMMFTAFMVGLAIMGYLISLVL